MEIIVDRKPSGYYVSRDLPVRSLSGFNMIQLICYTYL